MRNFVEIAAEQRSPAWKAARVGRLTGSVVGDILARTKSGYSTSRKNLAARLVLERLTGKSLEREFITPAMQDGIDREADAFAAFEAMTGEVVSRSGFLSHVELMAGASLDGHMGDFEALLSIKCRQPTAHLEFLKTKAIPAESLAQMRHEAWITGARQHTYFSWNPDFPEALQSALVVLTDADLDVPGYEREALAFLAEVDRELATVRTLTSFRAVLEASA